MLRSIVMFLRSRRGWLVSAALFVLGGCLSPTLPLPPPSDPTISATDTAGLVRLTGTVEPDSDVFCKNLTTDKISGQYTKSGVYDFTLEAQERDDVSIWYVHGTVISPPSDFVVKFDPAP